jgi:hypothetical protein
MKAPTVLAAAAMFSLGSGLAQAHDVPNMDHTHAFEQKGYGTWRQGHSVNNEYGSITIWSPRTYTGYQQTTPVEFARPRPITQPPGSPSVKKAAGQDPAETYGKETKREYGE